MWPALRHGLLADRQVRITQNGFCRIPFCILLTARRNHVGFQQFIAVAVSGLLLGCNDPDSDVRLNADECLNRTIKASPSEPLHPSRHFPSQ
jgi:hypothetical protein